jgi:hypothetical protein
MPPAPDPETYWDLIERAFDAVSIYDGPEVYDEQVAAYPEPIRHLLAAHWCYSEVYNGGFWQFFGNSTGVLAHDAVAGFRALGLDDLAAILEEAMSRLPAPYPRDVMDREEVLGPDRRDERIRFDDLDDRFFAALGDGSPDRFQAAANAYAAKHR